jgi:hypothetical protein
MVNSGFRLALVAALGFIVVYFLSWSAHGTRGAFCLIFAGTCSAAIMGWSFTVKEPL